MSERQVQAQFLRVGTELLTPDGWQTITGMLAFAEDEQSLDQVTVHTPQKTLDDSNGWGFRFGEMVTTRGRVPAESGCPSWCVEHYAAGDHENEHIHASFPDSVPAVEACTGEVREIGLWAERRTDDETGEVEMLGLIELKTLEDVELPPERLRELARKLGQLADMIEATP